MRLIVDPPQSGPRNMAIDEALLESVGAGGPSTWRFYEWVPATLSLGYFQRVAERGAHAASRACPLVRRLSGGGAILHDRELTYSFTLSDDDPLARDTQLLYRVVHSVLIDVLRAWAVTATLSEHATKSTRADEPFLCFERRAVGDVLLGDFKIGGSAQRRRDGAVLQHGSIILNRSTAAPELLGINDLAGLTMTAQALATAWSEALSRAWRVQWMSEPLSDREVSRAIELEQSKFTQLDWNERR